MSRKRLSRALALLLLLVPATALSEARRDRFSLGGYFRVMTRPDFQGGNSRLGYWNLYGRLLNEGPWAALELRVDALQANPGTNEVWAAIHSRVEGGSVALADPGRGSLDNFRLTQLYVRAGNLLFEKVTWQLGTLESYFGDLGLYDMRPATVFSDTLGVSGRYQSGPVDVLLGVGDAGYAIRGADYNTVFSGGGTVRLRLFDHLELGAGGQLYEEPEVEGNRFAPYATPGMRYEDFVRHEVVKHFVEEHPGQEDLFPNPETRTSQSWKLVGYLGFGGFGPLRWDNLFASVRKLHPDNFYTESYNGRDFTLYVHDLTDQRYSVNVGNELQVTLWPGRVDATWSALYGRDENLDNTVAPGDDNRTYYSTVLRLQGYLTDTVHLLGETSVAREHSTNGRLYREHRDSIFQNTNGVPDSRGLEFGDAATRNTWQGKAGLVLNPTGKGIFARPSLRFLYGLQYSSQQAAFGNGFVESLSQYNVFPSPERHWHSVVAVEAESWF